jgi:hypothetical protein
VLFVVCGALELRDNQRYGYLVAIKYYGTVFLKLSWEEKLVAPLIATPNGEVHK